MSCTVNRRKPPRSAASHNLLKPYPSLARWNGSPSRRNRAEPQCRPRRRLLFRSNQRGARQQSSPWPRDRGFESISLQRRVKRTSVPRPQPGGQPEGVWKERNTCRTTFRRSVSPAMSKGQLQQGARCAHHDAVGGSCASRGPSESPGSQVSAAIPVICGCKTRFDTLTIV